MTRFEPRYLTPRQLAERWGLSTGTLANWRYRGQGPRFIRLSNRVLYPVDQIRSFEELASWPSTDSSRGMSGKLPS